MAERRCGKSECPVAMAGECLEGHSPVESCPFFGRAPEDIDEEDGAEVDTDANETEQSVQERSIALASGEALDEREVARFLRWRPAHFITIIGDSSSGKTTLVGELYTSFLRGPFAKLYFAGSRTLIAFERRVHGSRAESGAVSPDTARTSIADGLLHLHLGLRADNGVGRRVDLLLSDRAGETYRRARDNTSLIAELIELGRAHRIVLLLDGAKLADPFARDNALQSVRQTLRAFTDNGALGTKSHVQVVLTKADVVRRAEDRAELEERYRTFFTGLERSFGIRLASLALFEVAARDPTGELPPATGVDTLLEDWIAPLPPLPPPHLPAHIYISEFDRLMLRSGLGEVE